MNTVTWMHFSDLHFKTHDLDAREVVLNALWRDIQEWMRRGLRPDFVVFSGDVAHAGRPREYELARQHFFRPLLETTHLGPADLIIVPGNHDVSWARVRIGPSDLSELDDRDKVNGFLQQKVKLNWALAAFGNYTAFVRELIADAWNADGSSFWKHEGVRQPVYSFVRTLSRASWRGKIAVVGLNSAWACGVWRKLPIELVSYAESLGGSGSAAPLTALSQFGREEYGRLLVGGLQVQKAVGQVERFAQAENFVLKIAVMHHPLSWLSEFDQFEMDSWLRNFHFVLHGHQHVPSYRHQLTPRGETIFIPASATYTDRDAKSQHPNGYNIVQLDLDTGKGRLYFRRYVDALREYIDDDEATGSESGGEQSFAVPGYDGPHVLNSDGNEMVQRQLAQLLRIGDAMRDLEVAFSAFSTHSEEARRTGRRLDSNELSEMHRDWERAKEEFTQFEGGFRRGISDAVIHSDDGIAFEDLDRKWSSLAAAMEPPDIYRIPACVLAVRTALIAMRIRIERRRDSLIDH